MLFFWLHMNRSFHCMWSYLYFMNILLTEHGQGLTYVRSVEVPNASSTRWQ